MVSFSLDNGVVDNVLCRNDGIGSRTIVLISLHSQSGAQMWIRGGPSSVALPRTELARQLRTSAHRCAALARPRGQSKVDEGPHGMHVVSGAMCICVERLIAFIASCRYRPYNGDQYSKEIDPPHKLLRALDRTIDQITLSLASPTQSVGSGASWSAQGSPLQCMQ